MVQPSSPIQLWAIMMLLWSWAQNNPSFTLALLILAIYLSKELLLFQLRSSSFFYYGALLPGVVIHELSHALGCLLTGAKIKKINLFSKEGGSVIHGQPKLPVVGNFIISIMPLISGLTLLILIFKYSQQILHFGSSWLGILGIIIIYYLALSILITMLPSYKDIANAALAYLLTAFAIFLLQPYIKNINLSAQIITTLALCLVVLLAINFTIFLYKRFK